ncbi:MAG TPA: phospholipase D-like domain-containing protein [Elusimicrobiota bacterium]|nr:phospholipase D-like domain-containing protein [Elusimicrobiota bacterium]
MIQNIPNGDYVIKCTLFIGLLCCAVLGGVAVRAEEVDLGEGPEVFEIGIDTFSSVPLRPAVFDVGLSDVFQSSGTQIYFSPEDNCDNIIIGCLYQARRSIDAAVFLISHPGIADALVHAHQAGLTVRVIMDGEQSQFPVAMDEFIERAGVPLKRSRGPGKMHNKFAILDGQIILTGSYNWTVGGASLNDENLIILREPVARYQKKFDRLWEQIPAKP